MSLWKLLFKIVDRKRDSQSGSWGESYWLWENDCYKGGETIRIHAPSDAIKSLMDDLERINPRALLKIKKVFIRHVRTQFRGSSWVGGYIEGDKEFLDRLIIRASWISGDGWNLGTGRLVVNGDFLEKLRWTQDIEEVYDESTKEAKE